MTPLLALHSLKPAPVEAAVGAFTVQSRWTGKAVRAWRAAGTKIASYLSCSPSFQIPSSVLLVIITRSFTV